MSEPAQLPVVAGLRLCPYPRGCNQSFPNTKKYFASNNADGRHPYCITCSARHGAEQREAGKQRLEQTLQRKITRMLGDGVEEVDLPSLRQLGAGILAVFGGIEGYCNAFYQDYTQTEDASKRVQYHRLGMRALEQAHKHELNQQTAAGMTTDELQAYVARAAQHALQSSDPVALANLLGVEKLQEALEFAKQEERIVEKVTQG